jgi:hypothetical protein
MTASLTVNGSLNLSGTLTLSTVSGGDIKIGGNWNFTAGGTFNSNSRAVFFIGGAQQAISRSAAGTLNFDYLVNSNTSGGLKLSTGTSVNVNGSGNGLQMLGSGGLLDLNGNTVTLASNVSIQNSGTQNISSSSGTGTFAITGGAGPPNVNGSGTLTFASSVLITLGGGYNFGLTTINGTLQINNGGFVSSTPPTYGSGSLLKYNSGTNPYGRGNEWNAGSGPGYPHHVQVSNNTTLNPGANSNTGTILNCAGDLTIDGGSAMYLDYGGNNMAVPLIVNGDININGTLGESQASGGDIKVRGDWNRTGTFALHGRAVFFDGSGAQVMSGTTTFDYVIIDKSGNDLTLNDNMIVNLGLTLTNGKIVTGSNKVTLNGGVAAMVPGSSSSYVMGILDRVFTGAGSKNFPIGKSGYHPMTLSYAASPGTSTVTAEQQDATIADARPPYTIVQSGRSWDVSETGGSGLNYFITLDASSFSLGNYDAAIMKNDGGTNAYHLASVAGTDYTNNTALTSFSSFAAAGACPDPTITGPTSLTKCYGESATFSVTTSPVGGVSFQWRKNTVDISGATNSSYTIASATPSDNGTYDVVVTRNCGSSATSVGATLTVHAAPSLTCPSPAIINTSDDGTGNCSTGYNWTHPDDGTNCSTTLTVSYTAGVPAPSSLPTGGTVTPGGAASATYYKGVTNVNYHVVDANGNTADCSFTVTVNDDENPTASNPTTVNVECFSDIPAPDILVVTDETDNCNPAPVVAFVSDNITSAACDGGAVTVIRTYSVTDASLNSINVYQTINVDDTTNPTASDPDPVSVQCFSDIPSPDVTVVDDEADNCDGTPSVMWISDDVTSAICDGATVTVTRTYRVTDCSGNDIDVYQTINVDDTTNPTASNPDPVSVQCFSDIPSPDVTVVDDEADNCDGTPSVMWISDDVTSAICDGATVTVTRTYRVTDCSGNDIDVYQTINVDDTTDPTASNPDPVSVQCFSDIPSPDVTAVDDEADNCDGTVSVAWISDDVTSASCDGATVTVTRTYRVTDCSGNDIDVYQTINVDDTTDPTASNPDPVSVQCFSDIPSPDVTVVDDEADNCDGTPSVMWISDDITSATCDGATVTVTRTYRVTDCSGNDIDVYQTINVDDTTDPTASDPDPVSVQCFSDIPSPDVTVVDDEADNCDGTVSVAWISDDVTSASCDGATVVVTRTYRVTDCSGNDIDVYQTINVDDTTDPTASNPDPVSVQCFSDIPSPDVTVVDDEADNCDGTPSVMWISDANNGGAGCASDPYIVARTFEVMDCSGNSTNVLQTITVIDNTQPVITSVPENVAVACASSVPAPNDGAVVANDNCSSVTISHAADVITPGSCVNKYTITRTYYATDACGNISVGMSQTIRVNDSIAPVVICPSNKTVNANNAGCTYLATSICNATATDNCGGTVTIKYTLSGATTSATDAYTTLVGVVFNLGVTTVTAVAYDACNNASAPCTFTVTVNNTLTVTCGNTNPYLYFGYTGDQTSTISGTPSGGTGPYTVSITMNRTLLCNQVNTSGDEIWTAGSGATSNGYVTCPSSGNPAGNPQSQKTISSGNYGVTVTLMDTATFTVSVTDANGCTATCTTMVYAEDVRCFAGNSGISKVTLCHKTGSTKNPCVKICVDDAAVQSHLDHGDKFGTCPSNCIWKEDEVMFDDHGSLAVYPNPNNGQFVIDFNGEEAPLEVIIMNLVGQRVYVHSEPNFTGELQHVLDLGKLSSGSYYVNVINGEHRYTQQIVITH